MTVKTVPLTANIPSKLLPKNKARKCYTVKNDSAYNIFVGHDSGVATTGFRQGLLVAAGGGNIQDEFWRGEVWAICEATVVVTVAEDYEIASKGEK